MIQIIDTSTIDISIHALRKESDVDAVLVTPSCGGFQSTLSVRRATPDHLPRRIRGDISIHALRKESDPRSCSRQTSAANFNPRSP